MKSNVKYWNKNIPLKKLILNGIIQKVFGFNRKVPWPVHWTTRVKSHEKIEPGADVQAYLQDVI